MPMTREKVVNLQRLGERLLLARRRRGLRQGALAKVAQVDVSLISRIERDVKPSLSVEVLGRLATALDASPNDLLGWGRSRIPPHRRSLPHSARGPARPHRRPRRRPDAHQY